jgi:dihydropteroate synthase
MESWSSPHARALPKLGERTLIMGILNVTPDSFSDGGRLPTTAAIIDRAGEMIAQGADVLDVGGESTRPGAAAVSAEEELDRVAPAIRALRGAFPDVPISIDTYKATVADAAISAGADMINDVWGALHGISSAEREALRARLRAAEGNAKIEPTPMASAVARRRCPIILMHNRPDRNYASFLDDVLADLELSIAVTRAAGVMDAQIWTDPGFGFAKNVSQNLAVLRDLHRIVGLGHPVLVGTSRKSTLGAVLKTEVDDRVEAGGATVVWAIQQGCTMVRVHDVREMARFVRMADAIKAGLDFSAS